MLLSSPKPSKPSQSRKDSLRFKFKTERANLTAALKFQTIKKEIKKNHAKKSEKRSKAFIEEFLEKENRLKLIEKKKEEKVPITEAKNKEKTETTEDQKEQTDNSEDKKNEDWKKVQIENLFTITMNSSRGSSLKKNKPAKFVFNKKIKKLNLIPKTAKNNSKKFNARLTQDEGQLVLNSRAKKKSDSEKLENKIEITSEKLENKKEIKQEKIKFKEEKENKNNIKPIKENFSKAIIKNLDEPKILWDGDSWPDVSKEIYFGQGLGEGSFAKVYSAFDKLYKLPVAVKVIHKKILKEKNRRKLVENEILILSKMNHKNIGAMHRMLEDAKRVIFP